MELHSLHKTFHHSHVGEEKQQMLNLNRRLGTYLNRVKLLEEENALLAKEIQALRHSNHGASARRKGLEEELRQARMEVDTAWKDRVYTEVEVSRLAEELQALDLQRQKEAQAHVEAKMKVEQSRKELEEERRAQIWLREKVSQLEHEMRHLIQTHQEDVAHLEATLTHSRATMPPTLAQRGNQTPNLLQLGQEYAQRANRAWQETAEAYQGQLAQLEESLNQTRSHLIQVGREKSESQQKLQALEKEIASAQDVRLHLEKTAAQRGQKYSEELQQLQEHLEGLEAEKEELGQQIDHLVLENRGLLQAKMSLGLEVCALQMAPQWRGPSFITITTDLGLFLLLKSNKSRPPPPPPPVHRCVCCIMLEFNHLWLIHILNITIFTCRNRMYDVSFVVCLCRALLDGESFKRDVSFSHQPRNISITDAVFSPQGAKKNYQTQLSAYHKTTSLSSVRTKTGTRPAAITSTPLWSRKAVTPNETPKTSVKPAYEDTKSSTCEAPYPKILQDGAVESFRPQEVQEKVTYAEPLSPPNEQETMSDDKEVDLDLSNDCVEPNKERPVLESVVSYQVESGLSTESHFNEEVNQHQLSTSNLTPYHVRMTEEPCGFSDESDKDASFEIPAEKEDMQGPHPPIDAWVEKEGKGQEVDHVQEEASDSETEAVREPNFESRTSSPMSEYEPEESAFNKVTDLSRDDNILKEDGVEIKQEVSCSIVATNEKDVEDKLYPDGEEMDTWDSVIERKVDLKTDNGIKKDEEERQRAEPEEDISTREHVKQDSATGDDVASPMMDTQVDAVLAEEHAPLPENGEDDEEEDSQNVSVSWRTELESDSYCSG
ncbi:Nestin [Nibea albiflora]|uniref:Nestin n=1 Tax=Nibea albiflora TaxID=240163 RepID=A0ACB7F640_NIBAL|nr:Nestin [Nibea albiflora]